MSLQGKGRTMQSAVRILVFSVFVILAVMPRVTCKIDDIILDLEDPEDYMDEVVASFEREQAERERQQVEAAARCRVRCLANRKKEYPSLPNSSQYRASLEKCLREEECTSCMKPCSQPLVNLAFCKRNCQGGVMELCEASCHFLQVTYAQRMGQCPSVVELSGQSGGATCQEACLKDSDCPGDRQKCCSNGCGHVCVQPSASPRGVPTIPAKPEMTEVRSEGAMILEWDSSATNRTGPVLYIVWVRWNVGKHHSDAHMTHWQQIAQTTDTTTVIRDISPGHWYQYQVSAVNINGSQGASLPTEPFCLQREPSAPGVPQNLTEGGFLIRGNHVTISVQWKPPAQSDLPVTRYKIFWTKTLSKQPIVLEVKEHRHVIPGDQLQFDVPEMDPESTYLVQVQAICQYGDSRLKSEKASIYLNTYPLSRAAQLVMTTTMAIQVEDLPPPPALTGIKAAPAFFHNGLLRANVTWSIIQDMSGVHVKSVSITWSPEACIAASALDNGLPKQLTAITEDQFFVIYELRFDCRYIVRVRPTSEQGVLGPETRMSFVTPSCGEVIVTGTVLPDCPSSVPRVPEEPANLRHSFTIAAVNISAMVTWDPPLSDSPVTKYRITWGETFPGKPSVWDKNTVLTTVVEKEARSFQLRPLREGITYVARVQALSRIGQGKVATLTFTTPVVTVTTQRDINININPTSSHHTPYQILPEPPDKDNQVGKKYPVTAYPPSGWSSGASLASNPAHIILLIALSTLCTFISTCLTTISPHHSKVSSSHHTKHTIWNPTVR